MHFIWNELNLSLFVSLLEAAGMSLSTKDVTVILRCTIFKLLSFKSLVALSNLKILEDYPALVMDNVQRMAMKVAKPLIAKT